MGMFGRIFGKKEKPPETVKKKEEVDFDGLEKIVSGIEEKELRTIEEKGRIITEELRSAVSAFRSGLAALSDARLTEEQKKRDMRTYDIVKGSKEGIVSQLSQGAEFIRIPEKTDRKTLVELNSSLVKFSDVIVRNAKNINYASIMFGEHVEKVRESLKMFDEIQKEILDCLNSDNFRLFEKIKSDVSEAKELHRLDGKLAERQEEIRNTIQRLGETKKEAEKEIETCKTGKEYGEYQKSLSRMNEIRGEMEKENVKIRAIISPLMKPLRSLNRIEQDRQKSCLIERYLENPAEAITGEGGLVGFKGILPELGSSVKEGKVKVQSETDIRKSIDEITRADVLSVHVTKNARLQAELDEITRTKFGVLKRIENAENRLRQDNKGELEKELLKVQEKLGNNQEAMDDIKRRLEGLLPRAGYEVRIV